MRHFPVLASLLLVCSAACVGRPPSEGEGEGDVGEGEGEEGEGEEGEGEGEEGEGEGEEGEGEGEVGDGVFCPIDERVGFIRILESFGSFRIDGRIDDGVPPELGAPVVDEGACAHYQPADCGGCAGGQVCGYNGGCQDPVSAIAGVAVDVVTTGGAADGTATFTVNEFGRIEGEIAEAARYAVQLRIPGQDPIDFAADLPAPWTDLVTDDQGSFETGPVELRWTAGDDGAVVRFFLKPNHHAPIGFSECIADDDVEALAASAAIIDPLRKVTGFEGGTGTRLHSIAVELDIGCVEVSIGRDELLFPE